jgi:two-component system chemotaxis sensor kinase CheA
LVIVQSQLSETARRFGAVAPTLAGNVAILSRLTKELQHNAMSLRMIPIQPTFQKMERLARDLARGCGKQAVFTTAGGETELDRTMVEEIADPLVHMVRNALDHGLETGAERVALGKPETGTVSLRAFHQGGKVVIELRDDGRGLNREKILAKAREKGLVPAEAQLGPDEILQLIFLPGFSTAEKVTAVSGRGVGMDVVRRNLERLRGEVAIATEAGRGTVFTITLPLTMAIIDGLVVRVGEHRFVVPSSSVQRAVRTTPEHIVNIQGCGEVLDLRGRLVPLRRLDRLYGIAPGANQPGEGIVVIIEHSGKTCALIVDEMVGKQEVVIKNLGAYLQGRCAMAGAAILGDGTIALILDPGALLQAA